MKRILALALILTAITASASRGFSTLTLRLPNFDNFKVELDNQVFANNSNVFYFPNLHSGNHYIKVTKINYKKHGHYRHHSIKTLFEGLINIPANTHTISTINHKGGFSIIDQTPIFIQNNKHNNHHRDNWNNNNDPRNYNKNDNYREHISLRNMEMLINIVNNTTFEDSKLQIVRQAISTNYFKAEQVRQLLQLFTFENSKLEIAKMAYTKTINKENYFIVNDAFTFNSSISELNEFINYRN